MYCYCNKKFMIIPTREEKILIYTTGIDVILANRANSPISTKVATPEDAANLVFIKISFFITSFVINSEYCFRAQS